MAQILIKFSLIAMFMLLSINSLKKTATKSRSLVQQADLSAPQNDGPNLISANPNANNSSNPPNATIENSNITAAEIPANANNTLVNSTIIVANSTNQNSTDNQNLSALNSSAIGNSSLLSSNSSGQGQASNISESAMNGTDQADNQTVITTNATNITTVLPNQSINNTNQTAINSGSDNRQNSNDTVISPNINDTQILANQNIIPDNTNVSNASNPSANGTQATSPNFANVTQSSSDETLEKPLLQATHKADGPATITVYGSASLNVVPDLIILSIQINSNGDNNTAALASDKNTFNSLIDLMGRDGVDGRNITTTSFTIGQLTNQTITQDKTVPRVSHKLTIIFTTVTGAARFIDSLKQNNDLFITEITCKVSYVLTQYSIGILIQRAAANARSKAEIAIAPLAYAIKSMAFIDIINDPVEVITSFPFHGPSSATLSAGISTINVSLKVVYNIGGKI